MRLFHTSVAEELEHNVSTGNSKLSAELGKWNASDNGTFYRFIMMWEIC